MKAALLEVKVAVVLQSAHVHLISGHDEVDDFLDGFAGKIGLKIPHLGTNHFRNFHTLTTNRSWGKNRGF